MSPEKAAGLRKTPLTETHRALGARLVEFGGFEMPVQYSSIIAEHSAVRETAGLFDVSHMGQIYISGPGAIDAGEQLLSCRVENLGIEKVRYGMLCNHEGGVVDDVTVYRIAEDSLMLCVNASNIEKDHAWILANLGNRAEADDRSDSMGMLALQGPAAAAILEELTGEGPASLARFSFAEFSLLDTRAMISSTGYTGAPGFELYLDAADVIRVFEALLERGEAHGLLPAGLGARDTLRLEAALPLYGHELDDTTSPLEAGLGRFVKRKRGGFVGAEAIERRASEPQTRKLVGFEMCGRGIARADYPIARDGLEIGRVTSGAPSPSLGSHIGLGYVSPLAAEIGNDIDVMIRGKAIGAKIVATPFVEKVDKKSR